MWYYLNQYDAPACEPDMMVDIEAGETNERALIRNAQEAETSLAARLARRLRAPRSQPPVATHPALRTPGQATR